MTMDEFHSLRQAGVIDDPAPEVFERAQQILREYIASNVAPVVLQSSHRRRRLTVLSGAGIAVAVAAAVAALLPVGDGNHLPAVGPSASRPSHTAQALVSNREIRLISSESSTAMATSGTARVVETEKLGSSLLSTDSSNVTFSGENLDFSSTSTFYLPVTTNPTAPETSDDRLVDGQVYLYIVGEDGQISWQHDTAPDAQAGLTFPDPRTLMQAISPSTGWKTVGHESVDGIKLTELSATDPVEIGNLGIPNFNGSVGSFDVWVDPNYVVRQMSLTSVPVNAACMPVHGVIHTGPGDCVMPQSGQWITGSNVYSVNIQFANLGEPESVKAPVGAVDVDGVG
jgi:hypothetical protein